MTFARTPTRRCALMMALAAILLPCGAIAADASTYLLFPSVVQGEREIDLHCGVGSAGAQTANEQDCGIGLGIGISAHWFTELALQVRKVGDQGRGIDALEWENIFTFAEPNEWPVDLGLALEIERPRNPQEGPSLRVGPLLQKEFGRIQANFNVLASRHYQTDRFESVQLRYQGQVKYRYSEPMEFGVQAFGNLGTPAQSWSAYAQQNHRVGPVLLGRFPLPAERAISYNAAFLLGTTARSADRTLRVQIEYEF